MPKRRQESAPKGPKAGDLCPRCRDAKLNPIDISDNGGICAYCVVRPKVAEMKAKGLERVLGEDDIFLFTGRIWPALEAAGFTFERADTMVESLDGYRVIVRGAQHNQRWGPSWLMRLVTFFYFCPPISIVAAARAIASDPEKQRRVAEARIPLDDGERKKLLESWGQGLI
jgi:hypothetical protein